MTMLFVFIVLFCLNILSVSSVHLRTRNYTDQNETLEINIDDTICDCNKVRYLRNESKNNTNVKDVCNCDKLFDDDRDVGSVSVSVSEKNENDTLVSLPLPMPSLDKANEVLMHDRKKRLLFYTLATLNRIENI